MPENDARVYTVKEVADLLEFSTNTVYKYLDEGKIKASRLGKEGRFRIPGAEIRRLLGLKGKLQEEIPQQATADLGLRIEKSSTEQAIERSIESPKEELKRDVFLPCLFDWFSTMLAIFVGISSFLFPYHLQSINAEPYLSQIAWMKAALIILGLSLLGVEIFFFKKSPIYKAIQITLGVLFGALSFTMWEAANVVLAAGYFAVAFTLLTTAVMNLSDGKKFIFYIGLVSTLMGLVYLVYPDSFPSQIVTDFIRQNPVTLGFVWFGLLAWGLFLSLRRGEPEKWMFFLVSLGALIYAVFAIRALFWEQTVTAIILASFALIAPFSNKFVPLTQGSKKELLGIFAWLATVFALGIGLVYFLQYSFKNYLFQENKRSLIFASNLINEYLEEGKDNLSELQRNEELVALMSSSKKDLTKLDELAKILYFKSKNLRRIIIVNEEGKGESTYPADNNVKDINVSDREYFKQIKQGRKIVTSEGLSPRFGLQSRVVLIAVPIVDSDSTFRGVLIGSVDLTKLQRRLNDALDGGQRYFVIADKSNQIIMHPDSRMLLSSVSQNLALKMAVEGKEGAIEGYTNRGILSLQAFRPIESLGWGLVVQQPLFEVSKQNSTLAFVIFLVTILTGTGSLMGVILTRKSI